MLFQLRQTLLCELREVGQLPKLCVLCNVWNATKNNDRDALLFSATSKSHLKHVTLKVFIGLGIEDRCPRSFCGNHKMA